MTLFFVDSFWQEIKKDAAFIAIGFALGCYTTYKFMDEQRDHYQPSPLEQTIQNDEYKL